MFVIVINNKIMSRSSLITTILVGYSLLVYLQIYIFFYTIDLKIFYLAISGIFDYKKYTFNSLSSYYKCFYFYGFLILSFIY